ncbi:HD domain-containing phosphohydrolase [Granulosicoccus antarcticus]|uniref:Hydrogenase transcriptional regulatory protein hupR1 n=1 Tax=Granulosicoccus antarcticus IMCC3135 TaxID=1192854 RepID=A0A2Z2NNR1_9GAMM|nr:HD domain-containing phosphohydrolase [Granulosicoccus antarcticus]ASJ72863.1 Hydrogenase transcriptional regulatory protein hupR1 [Granulosicoccus antarcticus IMCC3135]
MNAVLQHEQAQILFVDDERPILNSLNRLFRSTGYKIHLANSGAEALTLLAEEKIDIVISDMRMPAMDGAAFLSTVAKQWPATVRMLLTGYADLSSAIEAINQGEISRYLTKPWDDSDIIICVEQALQNKRLLEEKAHLELLNAQQNEELSILNESLEKKVEERTREIEFARQRTAEAHDLLKSGYAATIEVFSRIVQSRSGLTSRASVALDSRAVGQNMGLDKNICESLYNAALLCDIGKLGLSDESVQLPYTCLEANSQREYQRHPIVAEATLLSLEPLSQAAITIRHHCERMDGTGFPDQMSAEQIPMSSRILAVTKAYIDLQDGRIISERLTAAEARKYLLKESGKRYDGQVVTQFLAWLDNPKRTANDLAERKTCINSLRQGNRLSRDICDPSGVLIIAKDKVISDSLLLKLTQLQQSFEEEITVYIRG